MLYARETGEDRHEFMYGAGCKSCDGTGYRGRTGIFELLSMTDSLKTMLLKGATAGELRSRALEEGMVSLMKDGMNKVKDNVTTPTEVIRNAYSVG